ncbi:hypothetical protein PIB30_068893 [Stylosanthes scabra]|uniref:Uncharacterized protein n=1 Tax=Stylosanthes scabra TaxID=79078 RepID=A0ABU6SNZ3_9FABA|nr:hypothetical protein [Stylosanthes scabra]
MVGGLSTLVALRHRLIAKQQSEGDKDASSLTTVDLTEGTPVTREDEEPEKSEARVPSTEPTLEPSLAKKKRKVQKEAAEESNTSVNLLEKGFALVPFVDKIYCQHVQRENVGIPTLRTFLSEKEKNIKSLNSWVTKLEEEERGAEILMLEGVEKTLNERTTKLEEEKRAGFSKVSAYNKVVDGQIVEVPIDKLPEVRTLEVPK